MVEGDKKRFVIKLDYFNEKGMYHASGELAQDFHPTGNYNYYPNMSHVLACIRGLRDSGGQGGLPGLEHEQMEDGTEGWNGFVLIECRGARRLLLPQWVRPPEGE